MIGTERDLRLLWAGGFVSDAGDWLLLIALPLAVYGFTGSPLAMSTVVLAELVPALVLGTVAGVLVDRWDRRRTLIVVGLVQAVALVPLMAASADRLWLVYLVAAVQSALTRLAAPAKVAILPALVAPERLARANALIGVNDNLARLVGSPLGGLAFEHGGLRGVVVADAVSFLLGAGLFALIRPPGAVPAADRAAGEGLLASWWGGIRTIVDRRPLRVALLCVCLSAAAQGLFVVLFVLFVARMLHGDGGAVGLLRGVQAVGAVLGGLAIGLLLRRIRPVSLVGGGLLAFGLLAAVTWHAPAVTEALPLYLVLFGLVGVPAIAFTAGLFTLAQAETPPTHLGRVASVFETGGAAMQALGVLAAGVLTDRVGLGALLDVQAGLYVIAGGLAVAFLGDRHRRVAGAGSAAPHATTGGIPRGGP